MEILILVNAYAPQPMTRQVARIKQELTSRGATVTVRRNAFVPFSVDGDIHGDVGYDACVYLDKDKYTAELLEKRGVRLFNTARAIALCDDKMLTHIALTQKGIAMPTTVPGPLCYYPDATPPDGMFDRIEEELGYPVVVKRSYGSQGAGVFKADSRAELVGLFEQVKTEPHLYQRYIASSKGRDMRVIVIGGNVVGGIIRESDTDFRSNIGLGGRAQKTTVPGSIAAAAKKASAVLGLDYCGIDFLLGDEPLLCEVNSNAFFDAFETATNINVAGLYAQHIIDELTR